MKTPYVLIYFLVLVTFLYSCNNKPVDKKAIDNYYFKIQTISQKEDSCYKEFTKVLKFAAAKAIENETRQLDSINLLKLENEFGMFIERIRIDKADLQNIIEVDETINLKFHFEKHISYVDSSLRVIMPIIFHYLKIGWNNVDKKFENEMENFKKVTAEQQRLKKNVIELADKFRTKYPD